MTKKIRITSETWLDSVRQRGGVFHVRMSMNVLGCCKFVHSPGGFVGEPQTGVDVREKPEDYFEIVPVDSDGRVIEGIRGSMHPGVLTYMEKMGPSEEGDYLMHANVGINSGRVRYALYDD